MTDLINKELKRLRAAQAKAVMPLIGPLLDAWEQLPNDVLDMEEFAELLATIEAVNEAMENAE